MLKNTDFLATGAYSARFSYSVLSGSGAFGLTKNLWALDGLSVAGGLSDFSSLINWEVMLYDPDRESLQAHTDRQVVVDSFARMKKAVDVVRDPIWGTKPRETADRLMDVLYGVRPNWHGLDRRDFAEFIEKWDYSAVSAPYSAVSEFLDGYWPYSESDISPTLLWCWAIFLYGAHRVYGVNAYMPGTAGLRSLFHLIDRKGPYTPEVFDSMVAGQLAPPLPALNEIIRKASKIEKEQQAFLDTVVNSGRREQCRYILNESWHTPLLDIKHLTDRTKWSAKQMRTSLDMMADNGILSRRNPSGRFNYYLAAGVTESFDPLFRR